MLGGPGGGAATATDGGAASEPCGSDCAGYQAILSAAMASFAEGGYAGASVAQIARAAGVSKANIFYHFGSKEGLYLAVMRALSARHAEYAEALVEDADTRASDKLLSLFLFEMREMFGDEVKTRLVLREFHGGGVAPVQRLAFQSFERNIAAVRRIFEQGKAKGEFAGEVRPAIAALTWMGARHLFFQRYELLAQDEALGEARDIEVFARQVHQLLLFGLAAR